LVAVEEELKVRIQEVDLDLALQAVLAVVVDMVLGQELVL